MTGSVSWGVHVIQVLTAATIATNDWCYDTDVRLQGRLQRLELPSTDTTLFSLASQPKTKVWLLPVQAGLLRQRWWLGVFCFCTVNTQEHEG